MGLLLLLMNGIFYLKHINIVGHSTVCPHHQVTEDAGVGELLSSESEPEQNSKNLSLKKKKSTCVCVWGFLYACVCDCVFVCVHKHADCKATNIFMQVK